MAVGATILALGIRLPFGADDARAADVVRAADGSPEIDAWLDALPARQRALALSLYASDATHDKIAAMRPSKKSPTLVASPAGTGENRF